MQNPICRNCGEDSKKMFVTLINDVDEFHGNGEYKYLFCLGCRAVKDLDDNDDTTIEEKANETTSPAENDSAMDDE